MFNNLTDISIPEALLITVFSMGIVFAALLIIDLILQGFRSLFYKGKRQTKTSKTNVVIKNDKKTMEQDRVTENTDFDEEELVAVIAAALAASLSRPVSDIKINKIRRVGQETSVWSKAGRLEQMN
ncbi:MAG: hypothetical protein FH761_01590 [Firmicutes bacterium]|nr:hypothetical protein [Bacillota bacterium]